MSNSNSNVMESQEMLPNNCFIIESNGVVLDAFAESMQRKAVKEFICDYKPRGTQYKLFHVANGIKKEVHPSGSAADYTDK